MGAPRGNGLAQRLYGADPKAWQWLASFLALSTFLVGAMLLWWVVFGFWDTLFDPDEVLGLSFDGRTHLTMSVLLAFIACGTLWVRQGALREIHRLGAHAQVDPDELADRIRRITTAPRMIRGVSIAAALVLGGAVIPLTSGGDLSWNLHHVWAVTTNVIIFYVMAEGAWFAIEAWRAIDRYTKAEISIDLLDRGAFASIGRVGMRGAVLWLGGCIIASTMTWGMTHVFPLLVVLSVPLILATASLVLPAQLARRALREAKRSELVRIRTRIAEARDGALRADSADATGRAALLPGLLAYEARIESVREWPYDTPTIVRFAVLATIAAGSWIGGAIVERMIGSLLD